MDGNNLIRNKKKSKTWDGADNHNFRINLCLLLIKYYLSFILIKIQTDTNQRYITSILDRYQWRYHFLTITWCLVAVLTGMMIMLQRKKIICPHGALFNSYFYFPMWNKLQNLSQYHNYSPYFAKVYIMMDICSVFEVEVLSSTLNQYLSSPYIA